MAREELMVEYQRLLRSFGMCTTSVVDFSETIGELRRQWEKINDRTFLPLIDRAPRQGSEEDLWTQMDDEVRKSAQQLGYQIPLETYVNVFPTGSFNAQVCRVKAGALILVNTGLKQLIYKLMKLLANSVTIVTGYDTEGHPRLKGDGTDKVVSPGSDVSHEVAELVAAYLTYADPSRAQKLPFPTGGRGLLAITLTHDVEKFVLAHEYGHVIAGHLSTPKQAVSRTPAGELAVVSKSWQEELEADTIAHNIMLAGSGTLLRTENGQFELDINEGNHFQLVTPLGAAGIFFAVDELIEMVKLAITGSSEIAIVTDHPPSAMRRQRLVDDCCRIGGDGLARMADTFAAWIRGQADGTVYRLTHSNLLHQS